METIDSTIGHADAARDWDVIVIGCGPAGTAAAIESGKKGLSVLLVERKALPRPKVCGGCVNGHALDSLHALGIDQELAQHGGVALNSFQMFSRGRSVSLPLNGGVSITRAALDAILARRAVESGCQLLTNTLAALAPAGGFAEGDERRSIQLSHGGTTVSARARVVIVAAGLAGQRMVAEECGAQAAAGSRIGLGLVTTSALVAVPTGAICMAVARNGYVGLAVAENQQTSIAAAVDAQFVGNGGPMAACQKILEEAGIEVDLAGLDGKWTGTEPLTRHPVTPATHRLICVGDSAGYIEPFTGEGISWALRSGRLAAEFAVQGQTEWGRSLVSAWNSTYRREVRRRQRLCRCVAAALRRPWFVGATMAALSRVPQLAAPVVRRLSGQNSSNALRSR